MKSLALRLLAGLCLCAAVAAPTMAQEDGLREVLERFNGSWKSQVILEPGPVSPMGAQINALVLTRFHAGETTGAPMAISKISGPSARTEIKRGLDPALGRLEMWLITGRNEFTHWIGDWDPSSETLAWTLTDSEFEGAITERFEGPDRIVRRFVTRSDGAVALEIRVIDTRE